MRICSRTGPDDPSRLPAHQSGTAEQAVIMRINGGTPESLPKMQQCRRDSQLEKLSINNRLIAPVPYFDRGSTLFLQPLSDSDHLDGGPFPASRGRNLPSI